MIILSQRGSALLISMVVLTLVTVMSTVFFEKIFRFSQASEGIENSNVAYYHALGIIENGLFGAGVNKYTPWNIQESVSGSYISTGTVLIVSTGSTTVPVPGDGNSPYDSDYNIISVGSPVQLVIPDGLGEWPAVNFYFRIPSIGGGASTSIKIGSELDGFVLWTFASSGASLFASGETSIFLGSELDNSPQLISDRDGISNSGSHLKFKVFYNDGGYVGINGGSCVGYLCTLKLSLIKPVPTTDNNRSISFLEYKIEFPKVIPSQYMNLKAEGYANGFLRQRSFQFPQITTNTALDFAVLQ